MVDDKVRKLFVSPLRRLLQANGKIVSVCPSNGQKWVTSTSNGDVPSCTYQDTGTWDVHELVQEGFNIIRLHVASFRTDNSEFKINWKARRVDYKKYFRSAMTYRHEDLRCGTVIQALLLVGQERNKILRTHNNVVVFLFVIIGFLQREGSPPWAVVIHIKNVNGQYINTPSHVQRDDVQVLLLDDTVRRAAVYHVCRFGDMYKVYHDSRTILHGQTLLCGGQFIVQCRKDGYPPRVA